GHRKAKLRLDTPEGVASVLTPGKPDDSDLFSRVASAPRERGHMPPVKSGKTLSAQELALLKRWIEQGAPYEKHWSFAPPQRPPAPEVGDAAWPATAIDRSLLGPIEAAGLKPSSAADRATLARRLHLDLIGLPPSAERVDAFVADTRPDAYERLVAELLGT